MLSNKLLTYIMDVSLKIERKRCSSYPHQQQSMNSPAIQVWPYAHALLIGIRSGEPKSVEIVPTNKEPRKLKSPGFFVFGYYNLQ